MSHPTCSQIRLSSSRRHNHLWAPCLTIEYASHRQCKGRWRQLCLQTSAAARGEDSACLHGCRNPSPTPSRCTCAETQLTTCHKSNTHHACNAGRGQERMAATVPRPSAPKSNVGDEEGLHGCRNLSLPTHAPIPTVSRESIQLWFLGKTKCDHIHIHIYIYIYML